MSLSTIAGFLGAIGLFVGSILISTDTSTAMVFINIPSVLMVMGGTLASAFIAYEAKYVTASLKDGFSILSTHKEGQGALTDEVGRIIRWGYIVQKNGLQGLESDAEGVGESDQLLSFGVDLVITGYTGDEVRDILANTVKTGYKRANERADILRDMGGTAPAFGMIGTLVGLVIMLQNMSGDPSSIGGAMAVALITTLYGVMAARILFLPAGTKVGQRNDIERFRNFLLAEGLALLAERKSPRYIQDRMNSFLDPAEHYSIDRDMTSAPS